MPTYNIIRPLFSSNAAHVHTIKQMSLMCADAVGTDSKMFNPCDIDCWLIGPKINPFSAA